MSDSRIIIIGGGAAGMMAAGQAASSGAEVMLLEKMSEPGMKLRITGKGRCNLTNIAALGDFIDKFGKNGKFLHQAFNNFFSEDLAKFFADAGVDIKVERGGRVFPDGNDAPGITRALEAWVRKQGVTIVGNSIVTDFLVEQNEVKGVRLGNKVIRSQAVILATGGLSYPATGSTGDGYRLAASVGHTIKDTSPSLVPLLTAGSIGKQLHGLTLRNVAITSFFNNKKSQHAFGEMRFKSFGLSGPIILTCSKKIIAALEQKKKVTLSIDLKPALDEAKLDARLLREMQKHSKKKFDSILKELLPMQMIPVCIEHTKIAADKRGNQITAKERGRLRNWLKNITLEVTGYRTYDKAIVTAGGVSLKEIDPRTMASKIIRGLYFAGEVIDIDGNTGGYNLQASFSTGWLAGHSAAAAIT